MTIAELHTYLEETTLALNGKSLLNSTLKDAVPSEANSVKWEVLMSGFSMKLGKLESKFSIPVMEEGEVKVQHYPDLLLLGQDGFDYLAQRAEEVTNPYLRIRYNQLLFKSGRRRNQQGELIVDESLKLLPSLDNTNDDTSRDNWQLLLNAFCLSLSLKQYRFPELSDALLKVISDRQEDFAQLSTVVFVINGSRKTIPRDLLEGFHDAILPSVQQVAKDGDTFTGVPLITNLSKLGDSLGKDVKAYHLARGKTYERRGDIQANDDDNNLSATISYVEAMDCYRLAGDVERTDALGVKYAKIKGKVELTNVRLGGPGQVSDDTQKLFRGLLEHAAKLNSDQLFSELAISDLLLPFTGADGTTPEKTTADIFGIFTTANYDINGNAKVEYGGSDTSRLFIHYAMEFGTFHSQLLRSIFLQGMEDGTISFQSLMKYLIEETWLGQVLEESNGDGEVHTYSWAFSLSSYLLEFFMQLEAKLLYPDSLVNFQASLEGLTLKFEPIARDLVSRLDHSTIKSPKSGVVREVLLEELIEKIDGLDVIRRQDTLFFKYLYTSNGRNIRNNVAHGFLRPHQCTPTDCILVIVSLLRLGSFRFDEKGGG